MPNTQSASSRHGLLSVLAFAAISLLSVGCSKEKSYTPTEAETFALSVINQRFTERNGRWLALEEIYTTSHRLIELNKPTLQFNAGKVNETDRMNGITARCTISVLCEQYRHWNNGTWSDWRAGTSGNQSGMINFLTSGIMGYQHF